MKALEADEKEIFIFVQSFWGSPQGQFFDSVVRSHPVDPPAKQVFIAYL